eukprot:1061882-Pleurochrysis_carterae.AAC.3
MDTAEASGCTAVGRRLRCDLGLNSVRPVCKNRFCNNVRRDRLVRHRQATASKECSTLLPASKAHSTLPASRDRSTFSDHGKQGAKICT